ncbi:hypothetical protein DUI87_00422 [Hirundo rustica rustica]|uniref:Uncharacterized protein n=1 Tax=Hirundo rustica rustica TaxID=333673 RepID=A0A3M0LBQ0_HIRRU|nr:hypothetical protein DUI87_00422 [Hirundo rustica rustica]
MSVWSGTVALAKACVEVSKHRREFQRRGSKRHKGRSRSRHGRRRPAAPGLWTSTPTSSSTGRPTGSCATRSRPPPPAPLRLKCREFQAEELSAAAIVTLLESMDPSRVRRVDLRFNNLGLAGLSV